MAPGISFVICSRNGASRLPKTLQHLLAQRFTSDVACEVLLVDNASSDDTAAVARRHVPADGPMPLRVVSEPRPGTGYARWLGLREAAYDVVTFVDDDNWLTPGFAQIAWDIMEAHPEVALVPSRASAVFGAAKPPWFDDWQRAFAVGEQFSQDGDVTHEFSYWWTAGLTLRKSAWDDLIAQGFQPRVRGRDGKNLSGGEDTEMCLALLLAGWHAHYDSRLLFFHWMPANRLTWTYVCRLTYQGQGSMPVISAYRKVLDEQRGGGQPAQWSPGTVRQLARAIWRGPGFLLKCAGGGRWDLPTLQILSTLGSLAAGVASGAGHDALVAELRGSTWLGGGPERVARATTRT